jgi:2-polyprenyl-6-methoxyphenol hydroxylase-like FAD-dependent oxidoreductase
MLGLLLARAGASVLVLEKHKDFLRDFRGDTIHPSTLQVMHELGLLDELLTLPHTKAARLNAQFGETSITVGEFSRLPVKCPYIAFMPQWDFLDFLARKGAAYPGFRLEQRAKVNGLIERDGRIAGLKVEGPGGPFEVMADLVAGCDGRSSKVREKAGLEVEDLGAPMDALWFRVSRERSDPDETMGRFDRGRIFVMLNRTDYWQCAYVIPKGGIEAVHAKGIEAFRAALAAAAPFLAGRTGEIAGFEDVKLLTVKVDRLKRWWRPGLLCIGDAAHAMSPVGGVGINLAIQDAVAAANILAAPLREGRLADADLAAVERRRLWPTKVTQRLQVIVQSRIIAAALAGGDGPFEPPWLLKLLARSSLLRQIPARLVGLGVRPEHVATP